MAAGRYLKPEMSFLASTWARGPLAFYFLLWICGSTRTFAADDFSCGADALGVASHLTGRKVTDEELSVALERRPSGAHSLKQLRLAAECLGLSTRLEYVDVDRCDLFDLPMIVVLRPNPRAGQEEQHPEGHIVVLYGRVDDKVQVLDYPHAPLFSSAESLAQRWDGWGIYIGRSWLDFADNVARPRWVASIIAIAGIVLAFICVSHVRSALRMKDTATHSSVKDSMNA